MPSSPAYASSQHHGRQTMPGEAKDALKTAPEKAERARGKPLVQRLARASIAARAVVYVLLAFMTADIALTHHSPSDPSGSGALSEVAKQPGGRLLLGVLALGFLGYAGWRVMQAVSSDTDREGSPAGPDRDAHQARHHGASGPDHDLEEAQSPGEGQARKEKLEKEGHEAVSGFKRLGWAATAVIYLVLCERAASLAISASTSSGGGASSHPQPVVATVLRWPGGPIWVGLVGLGVAIGGTVMVVWAIVHDYGKALDTDRLQDKGFQAARATGVLGEAARGVLITLVAVYLLAAAFTDNPSHAKSLGGALYSFDRVTGGPEMLLAAALGLACFAVYSIFEVLYRKI